jgi:hypothetical protein
MGSLYRVNVGDTPMASDIDQFYDLTLGNLDVGGTVTLASQTAAPAAAPTVAATTGGSILAGTYKYQVTFLTGYKKSNGTIVYGGETTPSPFATVTTSSTGAVNITAIPTATGSLVVARNIYRTKAGGSTYYLVGTIADNTTTSFVDTTADTALSITVVPNYNSTGTRLQAALSTTIKGDLPSVVFDCGKAYTAQIQWNSTGSGTDSGLRFYPDATQSKFLNVITTGPRWYNGTSYQTIWSDDGTQRGFVDCYYNSSIAGIAINTWTKIPFNVTTTDNLAEATLASNRVTVSKAGAYLITVNAYLQSTASNSNYQLSIYKNGSSVRLSAQYLGTGGNFEFSTGTCIWLNANDYIEVYVAGTASFTLMGGPTATTLQVARL